MRRLADFVKGLIALALILLLLVGIPAALIYFVGEPFTDLRQAATGDLLSDNSRVTLILRGGLAIVAWLAWLQLAVSVVLEIVAVARGRVANRAPVMPGVQMLARKLVVTATLAINAFGASPAAVSALMPLALPPPVESVELETLTPIDGAASTDGRVTTNAEGPTYTSVAGDTFWSLAEATLGDGLRWSEVREANLGRTMADGTTIGLRTEVVRPGWDLVLPSDAVLPLVATPDAGSGETVPDPAAVLGNWEVEEGDHFWGIASETLADSYGREPTEEEIRPYWLALMEANRDRMVSDDADLILPGQNFEIPTPPLSSEMHLGMSGEGLGTPVDGDAEISADAAAQDAGVDGSNKDEARLGDQAERSPWTVGDQPAEAGELPSLDGVDAAESGLDASTVALGIFGTAVAAGGLLQVVRRRRQLQALRRRPGVPVQPVASAASAFESRIRPVADTEAVRWLDAANRMLSVRLAAAPPPALPAVIAMRAGEFGVEVLLDEPCAPPTGFVDGGGGGAAWRLAPDLDLDAIEQECRHVEPYSPALVPVGRTEAGDLLVDLEQLAVLSVMGDVQTIGGWMATIAAAVTSMPWSQQSKLVSIGVKAVLGATASVVVPSDVEAWADEAIDEATTIANRHKSSTYQRRVDAAEGHRPTIVLLGPGHDALAHRLRAAAELAHSPLVLVTTTDVPGHARVELTTDSGVLIPDETGLRLEFEPVVTESATAQFVAYLLDQSNDEAGAASGLYDEIPETVKRRPLQATGGGDELAGDAQWPPPPPAHRASQPDPDPDPEPDPQSELDREIAAAFADPSTTVAAPDPDETVMAPDPSETLVAPEPHVTAPPARLSESAADPYETVPPTGPPASPNGQKTREASSITPVDVSAEISRIRETKMLEARVLQAKPCAVGFGDVSTRMEPIIVYLATARRASVDEVGRLFWPKSSHRSGTDKAILHIQDAFGIDVAGQPRLQIDDAARECVVSNDVGSDWHRSAALISLAERTAEPADEMACYEAALGLIEDRPGSALTTNDYDWLNNGNDVYARIEARLVDAAHRLGDLALVGGRIELAAWAAKQGLLIVPGQEALHRLEMKAAALLDDVDGVERSYRAAVQSLEDVSAIESVQPETSDLYAKLTGA